MKQPFKGFIDLTRAHFAFAWPLLFCAGLMLAFLRYGDFSGSLLLRAFLIGLFGFEAAFVLNDFIDRDLDKKDVEFDKLTRYWRPFKKRPLPSGRFSPRGAFAVFVIFFLVQVIVIATLPHPNRLYLAVLMIYSFSMEIFYQLKKRNQTFPWAQILGRTDFALFPVAGYLCHGRPDSTALMIFLFMYPWALAHLGVNDIVDVKNDEARGLKSIPILYGIRGTVLWIAGFTLLHFPLAVLLIRDFEALPLIISITGFAVLALATGIILWKKTPGSGLTALPLFHFSIVLHATAWILHSAGGING